MALDLETSRTRLLRVRDYLVQDPANLNLLAEAADLSLAMGDIAAARAAIEQALGAKPGDPYFRSRLSTTALARQDWDEAVSICRALVEEGHDAAAIRYNLARGLCFSGQHAEARTVLERLQGVEEAPEDVAQLLIRTLHALGEVNEAIRVASAHLASRPEDHVVAGMLSLLHIDNNDLESARKWSAQALAGAPQNLDALLAAGTVQLASEDEQAATRTFDSAVAASARNGRAWVGKALAKLLSFDLVGARADFEQAVRYMPTHIGTWHGLAWVQVLQGDLDAAALSFERALDLDRNFGESHGGVAVVAAFRGQWAEAESHCRTALRLDPQSFSGRFVQSLRLQRLGRGDTARQLIERILRGQAAPGGGTLADMVLRISARRGRGP